MKPERWRAARFVDGLIECAQRIGLHRWAPWPPGVRRAHVVDLLGERRYALAEVVIDGRKSTFAAVAVSPEGTVDLRTLSFPIDDGPAVVMLVMLEFSPP